MAERRVPLSLQVRRHERTDAIVGLPYQRPCEWRVPVDVIRPFYVLQVVQTPLPFFVSEISRALRLVLIFQKASLLVLLPLFRAIQVAPRQTVLVVVHAPQTV